MKTIFYIFAIIVISSCSTEQTYNISEFHQNGNKKVVSKSESGKVVTKITYDEEGNMLIREEFFLDKLYGIWKETEISRELDVKYFGNGNKRSEGYIVDGKLDGRRSYYTRDGRLDKEKYFHIGLPTGYWVEYDYKGLKSINDYGLFKGNGSWTQYYSNGNVMKVAMYSNNQLHGDFKEYFSKGNLKITGNYHNGKKNQEWIQYNEHGDISKIENYSKGLLNGLRKLFHSNGFIKLIGAYKDNSRVGTWKWLDENGELIHSRQY